MRLTEVQHQDRALAILRRALHSGRTHHAYLFEGPDGVGKEMAALGLATRLLCQDQSLVAEADACEQCRSCHLLATGNHPDFQLIHRGLRKLHPDRTIRSRKGHFLSVDLIRYFLIEPSVTKPNLGGRRVFLIREAERMNEGAQNALLKTLEEPPGETCLILVTASAERLLPTIRSRCQCVPFGLLPPAFVEEQLASQAGLEPQAARTLARLAAGRLGAALRWHRLKLLEALDQVSACLERVSEGDPEAFGKALIETATGLAMRNMQLSQADEPDTTANSKLIPSDELRDALKLVLMLVAALYRDALVVRAGADSTCHLPQQRHCVAALVRPSSIDGLEDCLHAIVKAEHMLDRNVAPQLACERLGIALTHGAPM